MGADRGAVAALDAGFGIPDGNVFGDVAFFVFRGPCGIGSVVGKLGSRELAAPAGDYFADNFLDKLRSVRGNGRQHFSLAGYLLRILHFLDSGEGGVDGGNVRVDDVFSLAAVGLDDGLLDQVDRFVLGKNTGNLEERRLHDDVDPGSHALFLGDLHRVDDVEFQALVDDLLLHFLGQIVPDFILAVGRGEKECGAGGRGGKHVHLLEERELVAGDETGLRNQVGALDGLFAEPEVGNGRCSRLFRVVHEVALRVVFRRAADHLDRVLVGAHRSVRAEAVEQGGVNACVGQVEGCVPFEAGFGEVVGDSDGKMVLRLRGLEVVQDGLGHSGGELVGAQAVASADDLRVVLEFGASGAHHLADGGADVLVHGFAEGTRFLGPVEHGDGLHACGNRVDEGLRVERTEESDLEKTDFFAPGNQVLDGFFHTVRGGPHDDGDSFRVGGPDVIEEFVFPAREFRELVHYFLNNRGSCLVVFVAGFPGGEEYVGVLAGTADHRFFRREAAGPVGVYEIGGNHFPHGVVGDFLNLLLLVGGPEAVEEVEEGHAGAQRGFLGDQSHVHHFLDVIGGEHPEAGGAGRHDVGVIAENVQSLGRYGAGGDVENRRGKLPGDLEHVGNHQEQTLGSGKGRRQRACRQRPVNGARGSGLALQFDDMGKGSPDIFAALGRVHIRELAHR